MRLRMLLATVVAAVSIAGPLTASAHFFKGCSHTPLVTGTSTSPIYIDDRPTVWIYAESNGHEGYQSGGTSVIDETDIDGCFNHNCTTGSGCPAVKSDTLIL